MNMYVPLAKAKPDTQNKVGLNLAGAMLSTFRMTKLSLQAA
jgi:hypothetical protein